MASKNKATKAAYRQAALDHSDLVEKRAHDAHAFAQRCRMNNLSDAQGQKVNELDQDIDRVVQAFHEENANTRAAVNREIASLKKFNMIRRIVMFVLLLTAAFLLITRDMWPWALLLFAALLISRPFIKSYVLKKAQEIARRPHDVTLPYRRHIGKPFNGMDEASGICGEFDRIYLATLSENQQMMEQQRRLSERQMAQMRAQHREQMAAQEAALAAQRQLMEATLEEQQATNDALYGQPGVIGSALRARDKVKRQKGL